MKESFLHYVWKTIHFDTFNLKTSSGHPAEIVKPGIHNHHAGPDFSNAVLRIDNTLWVGQVEIHIKSTDWYAHNHQKDKAYDNVVLHVVYEHDANVRRSDNSLIPTLELKQHIDQELITKYQHLELSQSAIPCGNLFRSVPPELKTLHIESMAMQRLQDKITRFQDRLEQQRMNWESILYEEICYCFGLHQNALPFSMMAKQLPLRILRKHVDNPLQIEALLFGTAGLLRSKARDFYESCLWEEYQFLKHKYELRPIDASLWKMLRMRPANFPTIRIAQLSQLLHKQGHLFARLRENLNRVHVSNILKCSTSGYWNNHYTFGKATRINVKTIGQSTIDRIILNAVVPVFYRYASYTNNIGMQEQVVELLEEIPTEKNKVISCFEALDFTPENALQSQGLLQLHQKFCTFKKCLDCGIGHRILRQNVPHETEIH